MEFYQTLIMILALHIVAVAVPGPDFFCVSQASLQQGKKAGVWVALGIAAGLIVHIGAGIFGLVALMANPAVLMAMKLLCGTYLMYLGWQCLKSKPADPNAPVVEIESRSGLSLFKTGFLCNVLNPKVPMYFLSLFTVVIPPSTSTSALLVCGALMIVLTAIWFCMVAWIFSSPMIQRQFKRIGHWMDRVVGTLFLGFGLKVLLSSQLS